jgi:hypothetical protein
MDRLEEYRRIIQKIINDYAKIPYSYGEIKSLPVFDKDSDHYLLLINGREGLKRVHGCIVHIDTINDKVWIQRDGTEDGMATELLKEGIPKDKIVLGFRSSPEMRRHTEFALE